MEWLFVKRPFGAEGMPCLIFSQEIKSGVRPAMGDHASREESSSRHNKIYHTDHSAVILISDAELRIKLASEFLRLNPVCMDSFFVYIAYAYLMFVCENKKLLSP